VKWLLRLFYQFCDHLDQVMLVYCEYEKHKGASVAYAEALAKEPIDFYGGPRDGEQMLYAGLVYRIPGHSDGTYCFDGEIYKWLSEGHQITREL